MRFHNAMTIGKNRETVARQFLLGATILGLSCTWFAASSRAGTIELNAFDGSAVVKGDLLEVSHGSYVVKTALGTLRIGIDDAECIGDGCPRLDRFDADFSVLGSSPEITSSIQALLAGYAESLNADYQIGPLDEKASAVDIVDKTSSQQLASISLAVLNADETIGAGGGQAGESGSGEQDDAGRVSVFAEPSRSENADNDDDVLLALDAVSVIAHPDSEMTALSRSEIAQIFACREEAAALLPGFDGPPKLYVHQSQSDSYQTFKALVLDPFGYELCDQVVQLPSDTDIVDAVADNANALGIASLGRMEDVKPIGVEECGLVHAASYFSAKAGDYPLARRILMNAPVPEESSGAIQRFMDFALSDVGQDKLEDSGLVSLNLKTTSTYPSRYRLARIEAAASSVQNTLILGELLDYVQDAVRLSATFRFNSGASNVSEKNGLDNRSQRDLTRVISYLSTDAPLGTEILVLGFADASGDYGTNLALSRQRAQSIADKLAALGVPVTAVAGFGEEAPVACNSDPAGRAQNRRVEVWLRFPANVDDQQGRRITM